MTSRRWLVALALVAAVAVAWWFFFLRGPATVDPAGALPTGPGTALLIPGHGGNAGSLDAVAGALQAEGWTTQTVDIGDGSGDIHGYARAVTAIARQAADANGPVVLVGYSEGGLIARAAVAGGAAPYVSRVMTIATPHAGTSLAGLGAWSNSAACDTACRQMAPGSDFLDALPVAGDPSRWLAVFSDTDDVIRPADSGSLDGATNLRLQEYCAGRSADHGQVVMDPFVTTAVASFATTGSFGTACG
jgi:triacylglycerol lipase